MNYIWKIIMYIEMEFENNLSKKESKNLSKIFSFLVEAKVNNFEVYLDKECFDVDTWVCMYDGYMSFDMELSELARKVIEEFKDDKHIVG